MHGQDARPIESLDGTKATVSPSPEGKTVVLTLDPEVRSVLEAIQTDIAQIRVLLGLAIGE